MLATALRRHIADGPFEHFKESLLDAFTADIAGDADVLMSLGNLVHFINVDNAALGRLDVEVRGVKELQEQVFDILANVTGFGERCGVANGERHVEHFRQSAG